MATNVTYTTLIQDMQNYLERGGSVVTDPSVYEQLPRLINAAERKLMQALKLLGEIENVDSANGLVQGTCIIDKPDRWRQTVSLSYSGGSSGSKRTLLFPRSKEYCQNYWPDQTIYDTAALPQYYADNDLNSWLISPTAPETLNIHATLYMQPVYLDEENQENFFSIYCGNALLYGSLLEATPFLKNDDRIPTWKGFFEFELSTLAGQDLQRILDRSAQRSNP